MKVVEIYGRNADVKVERLIMVLNAIGQPHELRDTWQKPEVEAEMLSRNPPSGDTPQVFVGDKALGGFDTFLTAMADGSFQQIIGGR